MEVETGNEIMLRMYHYRNMERHDSMKVHGNQTFRAVISVTINLASKQLRDGAQSKSTLPFIGM